MKSNATLARRVLVGIVTAQLVASILCWAAINFNLISSDAFLHGLAGSRTTEIVVASLERDAAGDIRFKTTPELLAEMKRAPGLMFAAFDKHSHKAVDGSSPILAAALEGSLNLRPTHFHFFLPGIPPG